MRLAAVMDALPADAHPRLILIIGFGAAALLLGVLLVGISGPGTPGGTVGTILGLYGFGVFAVAGIWYTARFIVDHFRAGH